MGWNRSYKIIILHLISWIFILQGYSLSYIVAEKHEPWSNEVWERNVAGKNYNESPQKEKVNDKLPQNELHQNYTNNGNWFTRLAGSALFRVIIIVIVFSLLVYTLLKLWTDAPHIRNKKLAKNALPSLEGIEENLEEADLDRFLNFSIEAHDHKTAVRILYLILIRHLHEKKWITWKKDKTNGDFLSEMRHRKTFKEFRELTFAFEVVWYGDVSVTELEYIQLRDHFREYRQQIDEAIE
ncbi:MAG: DUF4129 domain-containing protein [Crocinitomicaceae bacterium]|nr:DUF4129 domain-containing protein [Crocinitomicaceae bacterium]